MLDYGQKVKGVQEKVLDRMHRGPLYLWGAAQTGIGFANALKELGIKPAGFIDKRKSGKFSTVQGIPVFHPDEILKTDLLKTSPFIVNTTTLHSDAIEKECRAAGLVADEDFISYESLCPFDYQVIVSSKCNLHCISCPLGNRPEKMRTGFMSAENYELVLKKTLSESPFLTTIQLFNWGEPFLNSELAEIVRITNSYGRMCALSSNMNSSRNLEEVIKAKPAFLRISMSGNENSYSISHTGGRWSRLLTNLNELHRLKNEHNPDLIVEVAYHVYNTTTSGDLKRTSDLCDSLGFIFRPHLAALLPLDNVKDYMEGKPLTEAATATLEMLRLPIDEAICIAYSQRENRCSFERTISIESDLSVKQCGLWVNQGGDDIASNYLQMPLEEIIEKKRQSTLCAICKEKGLHRFCSIYTDNASDIADGGDQALC